MRHAIRGHSAQRRVRSTTAAPPAAPARHAVEPRLPATASGPARARLATRRRAGFGAVAAIALMIAPALAPVLPQLSAAPVVEAGAGGVQAIEVAAGASMAAPAAPEGYVSTAGVDTLAAGGTNEDWAKLVLMFGEWPETEENVTVILRWMRQENGVDDWWNRNNPLNNGYGSGGGSGLGSYDDLVIAAEMAAENLHRGSFYADIVAALADGTSADATARAIWASPWATSHYANGAHWSTAPVRLVEAPPEAWG